LAQDATPEPDSTANRYFLGNFREFSMKSKLVAESGGERSSVLIL